MRNKGDWSSFGADHGLGQSPLTSCVDVWRDLTCYAWQTWMIFTSHFSATFKKTALGIAWGFVMPVVPLIAFFILTALRVFPSHDAIHPLSYMAVGMTLWLYLQGLIMAPTGAVSKYVSVLKSSRFPMICIFMASYGRLAFEMLVRIAVITPILLLFKVSVVGLLLMPLLLIPASALCVALGILLGLAGVVLPDLRNVAEIILRYLVFVSFVIFPLSMGNVGDWLYTVNPLAIFIDNIRNVLILGELVTPVHFYVTSTASFVLLIVVLHIYSVLERRVAEAL